jgi:glucose-1-phosphate thymidylyltransferase
MKGIILAGGSGTRLRPMTEVVCKQLLPVYDKPMIYYPLSTLIHAGVNDVLLICSPEELNRFRSLLGQGEKFGIKIDYAVQENPEGLPQGILIGEEFIQNQNFWFILGDNLFHGPDFGTSLKFTARNSHGGATAFAYRVSDVSQYGTVRFSEDSQTPFDLIEKPDSHEFGWAIPGLYHFDSSAVARTKVIKPSARGELEIIDLLQNYLVDDALEINRISRGNAWFDLGTAENLLTGSQFVHLIQSRQGLLVGSPEEASLNAGNLTQGAMDRILLNSPVSAYFDSLKHYRKEK